MSALTDLIQQVEDPELRLKLQQEADRLNKQKKFGLVFENHLPEAAPLEGLAIKKGSLAAKKASKGFKPLYKVDAVKNGMAVCRQEGAEKPEEIPVNELIAMAPFGEPIFPYLKPIDTVCNAPDSDLWHTLIEADNYHALQLLEYLYAGKVDCIYIDPPYNTGAKDWKYNNDYVDSSDSYRHSRWLSMMEKRLRLAKKLLNPADSVLIVTIDEKEYLHLGCLIEEMFPEANMQMVSSVINRAGTGRKYEFSRTDEYLFFVRLGSASIAAEKSEGDDVPVVWDTLRRSGPTNTWNKTKKQFYPIFVEKSSNRVHSIGAPLIFGKDKMEDVIPPNGCVAVYPIRDNGTEMMWGCVGEEFISRLNNGYIRVGKYTPNKPQKYIISYLTGGIISDIENGKAIVKSKLPDGSVDAYYIGSKEIPPTTNWNKPTHDAQWYGSNLIKPVLGAGRFSYPKSLYAVRDCIYYATKEKKSALILDFFAGSGTTMHAVNLLNEEDNGKRRCILVTNNEVSEAEAKSLSEKGYHQGDEEWEKLGIARYVTWPRTVCSIEGHDVNGEPLKGNYLGNEKPMSEGFQANAAFFKLGFLDKTSVSFGRNFSELLPVLWMQAGAHGPCPTVDSQDLPPYLILPENKLAVLLEEDAFPAFEQTVRETKGIRLIGIVTEAESGYREMSRCFKDKQTVWLYHEYLEHFNRKTGRNN